MNADLTWILLVYQAGTYQTLSGVSINIKTSI